jgi:hypothetical protein
MKFIFYKKRTEMAYNDNERTLSADIPVELFEEFNSHRKRQGQVKKEAVRAMIKLWIQLPDEIQAKLINQSLDTDSFVELVSHIANKQIKKALKKK